MLKTRIVTAIVLVSAFLLALFYLPPIGWLAVSTLIAALAAWEWGALIGFGKQARVSFGLAVGGILDSGCADLDEVTMESLRLGAWRPGRRRGHPADLASLDSDQAGG